MKRARVVSRIACGAIAILLAGVATAEKGGQGKGGDGGKGKAGVHGNKQGGGDNGVPGKGKAGGNRGAAGKPDHSNAGGAKADKGKASRKFASDERGAIQTYYRESYARSGNCPPGLAKKNNGCMPPGQARRWEAGSVLPPDVVLVPVPSELRVRLAPPVVGYDYGYVDGGVVLYDTGSRIVIDFVVVF